MKNYQAPQDLLKDRVILVTGAGQGIGKTAALTFAAHGATVILHGRSVKKLEAVYDEIEAAGHPQAAIFPLDLNKAEDKDFAAMAAGIGEQLGRLDGILHNAAKMDRPQPLEDQPLEQWLQLLRVNLAAPFALTRACLPLLKKAPDASIVMTSETHGHNPSAFWGGFAVAKSGVETLVNIWAQELAIHPNVRINAVVPGPVQSPQRSRTHPGERKDSLPVAETLMPLYLYLMGPDSRGSSGRIVEAATG
ncbi:MAG: YciK family oxidoreductase [Sulfuricella sp.]|nr:YciK family oxidoreductase [Sulfuricella sp.]